MPLDRQTVIDDIRASNPELFEGWTDEKLYLLIRQQIPDLNVPGETPGAASYRAYGAQEVPGFMDRVSHQLETQLEESKVGLYGMMPWTETEAYENFRMYNRNLYRQKIADNVELQALTAWKEDEPGWTNLHTASRSLSEALPSLAINIVGTAAGIGLAAATGGSSLMMTTATMAPIFALESSAQFNEAMSTLVDDVGLPPEEARAYAGITSLAYGSISTLLERIGAKHFLGLVGLREPGEQILKRTLAQRIVDAGVNSSKITRAGLRGSAGIAKTLEGALTEGVTETMQAYTQNTINRALELGLGEDDFTAKVALQKAFVETWDEKAVWEEGFAGATTGILGLPFGVGTRLQAGKTTSAEIADKIKETKGQMAGTPVDKLEREVPPEGPVAPTGVVSQYISAITGDDPTKASEFIESIGEDTKDPVLKKILKADQAKTGIGKKLLMIVGNDKSLVDEIANSEFGDMLTSEMVKSIIESEKVPAQMKGVSPDAALEDKINLLKNYAEYSVIQKGEVTTEFGEAPTDEIELAVNTKFEDTLPFDETGKPAIGDTEIPPGKDVAARVGGKEIPIKPVIPKKITAKVMKDFAADGTVPQGVLHHIANKIEAGKKLTLNEETIRQGKSAEIETLLKEKVETPAPTTPSQPSPIKFREAKQPGYPARTRETGQEADLTIDFSKTEKGSGATKKNAKNYLRVPLDDRGRVSMTLTQKQIAEAAKVLGDGGTLNIAGHGIYNLDVSQENLDNMVYEWMSNAVGMIRASGREITGKVITGGQTGFDEAAAKAAAKLGIETEVVAPKGFKYRTTPGTKGDVSDEAGFKARFGIAPPPKTTTTPSPPRTGRFAKLTDVQLENKYSELQTQRNKIVANKGKTESIDKEIKRVTDELALRQAKPAAKEQVDKYLEPMDRVQFPTAKSREEQIAVVDGKEVKLTEEELNSLELFIEMDSSPVKMVQAQAQVMLLELGRTLIEKHGKAEVKAEAKAEVPPKTAEEPTAAPTTDISEERKVQIVMTSREGKITLDNITDEEQLWYETNPEVEQIREQLSAGVVEESKGDVKEKETKAEVADDEVSERTKRRDARRELRRKNKRKNDGVVDDILTGKREVEGNDEKFQDLGTSNLPYIKDTPEFAARIAERLRKFFPNIEQATFDGLIVKYGIERIGMATEALVAWSTTDGRIDTIPHEYAHIYIKMFRDQDIVKRGIKLFQPGFAEDIFENKDQQEALRLWYSEGREAVTGAAYGRLDVGAPQTQDKKQKRSVYQPLKDWLNSLPKDRRPKNAFKYILQHEELLYREEGGQHGDDTTQGDMRDYFKQDRGEEALVKAMGEYFVDRMKNKPRSLKLRFEKWLKQFVARVKRMFGFDPKTKQEIMEFIAEEFYQGRWLGVTPAETIPFEDYMSKDPNQDSDANNTDTASEEEHGATGGESLNKTNTISSEELYQSFYYKALGIYLRKSGDLPGMMDIVTKKHTKFDKYLDDVYEYLEGVVADRNWAEDKSFKRKEDLTENELNEIRKQWTKLRQRNYRFSPTNKNRQRKDARLNFRIIRNYNLKENKVLKGADRTMGLDVADEMDRVNNKLFPDSVMRNSIERDYQRDEKDKNKHNIRLGILPIKQIIDRMWNYKSQTEWYKEASIDLTLTELDSMQDANDLRYTEKLISQFNTSLNNAKEKYKNNVPVDEIKESLKQDLMETHAKLLVINGTKFGDNSAVIGSVVEEFNPHEITPMMFKQAIDEELKLGNINENHYRTIKSESNLDELMAMDDDIINSSLSDYIDNWVNDNPNKKITDLIEELRESVKIINEKTTLSASLHNLRFWQAVRTPDYFMYEKSASDTMIRLSIDMAEGQRPIGLRDMDLMIVPKNYTVSGMIPAVDASGNIIRNKNGSIRMEETGDIPYDYFDGASMVGTRYLKSLANNLGYRKLQQIKTFIRHRAFNEETGKYDYLGMKHMMFAGFKNMVVKDENGREIARMETDTNGLTYWKQPKGLGSKQFDMLASPNEAKMTFGAFASYDQKVKAFGEGDHKSGYGVVHSIPSSSVVVNNVQEKSKNSASHPIALGELMLMLGYGNQYSDNVLKAIRSRYYDVVQHYTDKINSFYEDPKKFRDFVFKARDDGQIPSELDERLNDIGEDGRGIWHPAIRTHLLRVVNSIILRDGLNKARGWDGSSSILYIKPSFNAPGGSQHVKEGSVILSSDNKVAYNQVKKRWKESINKETYRRIMQAEPSAHDIIKNYLNPFLEQNDVKILIHRNPISKVTGPVVRRVQALQEAQGEAILMTWNDVKRVFDGDWDGDKGAFEFVPDDYSSSMEEWQQYAIDNNIDRTVSLPIFGRRVDDEKNENDTTALSIDNSVEEIARNASNSGATGIVMNARTIMAELFSKNFSMNINTIDDKGNITPVTITAADPNTDVIMNYLPIQNDLLSDEEINILKENGDSLVTKEGKEVSFDEASNFDDILFLKTIKSHELAILFQMAVDGSKFTHLGQILENLNTEKVDEDGKPTGQKVSINDFINSRIFNKTISGSPISVDFSEEESAILQGVKAIQNLSSQRHGRTRTRISADLDINLAMSRELNSMFNGDETLTEEEFTRPKVKGKLTDEQYSENFQNKLKVELLQRGAESKNLTGIEINLENNISPMESLLIGAGSYLNYDLINVFQSSSLLKNAHVAAMQEIMNSPTIEKYFYNMLNDPSKLESYQKAEEFLYSQSEVIENGDTKLGEALKITKPKKMSFMNIWDGLMKHTKDKEAIQADKNLSFAEFTDRFIDKYKTLDNDAQMWVTLKYLSGKTSGSTVYVNKLLPKKFENSEVMKVFLPAYEDYIRSFIKDNPGNLKNIENVTAPTPKVMREKLSRPGGYLQMVEEVEDFMDSQAKDPNVVTNKEEANC